MQCPQISDEKKYKFCSIDEYFLIHFLKDQKLFVIEAKKNFFSSEIWGHCIYFLQVIKSEYEGIYILQVLPSNCILPSDLKG